MVNQTPEFLGLLESVPDAMVIIDETGSIVLVNAQSEKLFGYARVELIGRPIEVLMPARVRRNHEDHRRRYSAAPTVRPMGPGSELLALHKNGHEFLVEISLSPLKTEKGTLFISSVRDVTERKRFEKTLQDKNLELEKASRTKDRFLASMSHELRTPLNAIIGFTGTMLMKLPGPLTADQDRQLHTVQSSAKHLLSLINDLLDLAKVESGRVDLSFEPVVCQRVIEEVSAALAPLAQNKGLAFAVSMPENDVTILTDRRALGQIVINLTNNAIKFTDKGSIQIEVSQVQKEGLKLTEIAVNDTGCGIRSDDQAILFEAFTQVNGDNAKRHEGTGLGLHLSQKLASLLNGRITFESEYGKGTKFTLVIEGN